MLATAVVASVAPTLNASATKIQSRHRGAAARSTVADRRREKQQLAQAAAEAAAEAEAEAEAYSRRTAATKLQSRQRGAAARSTVADRRRAKDPLKPVKDKVVSMWAGIIKDDDGQVERIACWDIILADQELASIVGNGDVARGSAMLQSMKDARALDQIKQDGRVSPIK